MGYLYREKAYEKLEIAEMYTVKAEGVGYIGHSTSVFYIFPRAIIPELGTYAERTCFFSLGLHICPPATCLPSG